MPIIGRTPMTVAFTDGSSPADEITYWLWDFGDGTTYEGQTPPAHPYDTDGIYTVTLSVASAKGIDTFSDTVSVVNLLAGLVGYWHLDEVNGTRVAAVGPDLLEVGGAVPSAAGLFGNSILGASEASASGLDATFAPVLDLSTGLTLAFWIKWPAWSSGEPKAVVSIDSGSLAPPSIGIIRFYNTGFLSIGFSWVGDSVVIPTPYLGELTEDSWHLFVISYDPTTGELIVRFDQGCLADAVDWTALPLPAYRLSVIVPPASLAAANSSTFSRIHLLSAWDAAYVSLEGQMDELRIWSRVIEPELIEALWNNGAGYLQP